MSDPDLAALLATSAIESKVAVVRAAEGAVPPVESSSPERADALADVVVADSGAVVLFGGNDRLRPILAARSLVAHAAGGALVRSFGDALARFAGEGRMVSICGPSRTADIEKTLVVGVHGPREVTIVLYGGVRDTRSG